MAIFILFICIIIIFSFAISVILSSRIKTLLTKKLYNNLAKYTTFEPKNFLFKLCLEFISPIIFIATTSIVCFSLRIKNYFTIAENISAISLTLSIGLIWLIYKIANLSSVGKKINKMFASLFFLEALFIFFGINNHIKNNLLEMKASIGSFEVSLYSVIVFIVVISCVIWFNKIFLESLKKILETAEVKANTKVLFVKFSSMFLVGIALVIGLAYLGLDIKSLTIFGSAIVVGLGFGFQKLVSNIISGITISLEGIIKEGDIITLDDKREIKGVVKSINMRYTLVSEFDGKEIVIPNDSILTNNIANLTHSNNLLRLRIDMAIPFNTDVAIFRSDVLKIMNANPYASKIEECVLNIDSISEIGIHIFLYFWIDNPFDTNIAKTNLLLDILNYIKEKKINLPNPITSIEIINKVKPS